MISSSSHLVGGGGGRGHLHGLGRGLLAGGGQPGVADGGLGDVGLLKYKKLISIPKF